MPNIIVDLCLHYFHYQLSTHLAQYSKERAFSTAIRATHQHIHPRANLDNNIKIWTINLLPQEYKTLDKEYQIRHLMPKLNMSNNFTSNVIFSTKTSPLGVTNGTFSNL